MNDPIKILTLDIFLNHFGAFFKRCAISLRPTTWKSKWTPLRRFRTTSLSWREWAVDWESMNTTAASTPKAQIDCYTQQLVFSVKIYFFY